MPHIQQLDTHLADLIAAGEVVERPASVVKELLENAIDAGADHVTVEIQHGGMVLVRVTDNGCGIAAEELGTAFLRHATSKLRTERDLEEIGTLGFRGEALAAIAAVSRVQLLTRPQDAALGAGITLEGGVITAQEEAGCPAGTTMVVQDLFFNTPARFKFVKKDVAEGAAVFATVQHLALSHPEVAVQFLRDGKQEMATPGDGALKSAVYAVLGRDLALGLTAVNATAGADITVTGFVSRPACCRASRGYQHFFVNGRYVKSATMRAAVEEAYQNRKMVGKFPGCVLHLTLPLAAVDVNVHPAKTEVKFASERKAFDAVYYAVQSALEADDVHPAATLAPPARPAANSALGHMTAAQYRTLSNTAAALPKGAVPGGPLFLHDCTTPVPQLPKMPEEVPLLPKKAPILPEKAPKIPGKAPTPVPELVPEPLPELVPEPLPELAQEAAPEAAPVAELPWRLVGELFCTYLVVEQGERALLIDKHAAHERMQFDRLKAAGTRPMVQTLLTPVVFTPPAEEGAALGLALPLLAEFGFAAEDFGGGALLVRAAPDCVDAGDIEGTLTELGVLLLRTGHADPDALRDALLHSIACKAAIKGGQKNDPQELHCVAQAVMSGAVKYCPHGRPVAIELTRAALEKQFKRA